MGTWKHTSEACVEVAHAALMSHLLLSEHWHHSRQLFLGICQCSARKWFSWISDLVAASGQKNCYSVCQGEGSSFPPLLPALPLTVTSLKFSSHRTLPTSSGSVFESLWRPPATEVVPPNHGEKLWHVSELENRAFVLRH